MSYKRWQGQCLFLHWGSSSVPHQAVSLWTPQCQLKPTVFCPGHLSALPLELSPHPVLYRAWLLEDRLGLPWLGELSASGRAALLCSRSSSDIQDFPHLAICPLLSEERPQEEPEDGERGFSKEDPPLGFPSSVYPSQGSTPLEIPGGFKALSLQYWYQSKPDELKEVTSQTAGILLTRSNRLPRRLWPLNRPSRMNLHECPRAMRCLVTVTMSTFHPEGPQSTL